MKNFAPIVLFVYNRPRHTRQTIKALQQNPLAKNSELIIYSDGPKNVTDATEEAKIQEVRDFIYNIKGFQSLKIIERKKNLGLAQSIISGVTEILNEHKKAIILEDDIITSSGFLNFMNDALSLYKSYKEVMHISGYMFPVKNRLPETFFLDTATCWGWGTWLDAWEKLNLDSGDIIKKLNNTNSIRHFNINGTYDYYSQLVGNHEKIFSTWAIFWYASIFLNHGYSLHPYPSLTNNIGNDDSGVHSIVTDMFQWKKLADSIQIKNIPIRKSIPAFKALQGYYKRNKIKSLTQRFKDFIYRFIKESTITKLKALPDKSLSAILNELKRIKDVNRFTEFSTRILNHSTIGIDSKSFLFMYDEIFKKNVYNFKTISKIPFIIDCGANIGLSLIYFKQLYPNARILAFEPDQAIFKVLSSNVKSHELSNVELINKALWSHGGVISFKIQGADAGKISKAKGSLTINSVKLSEFMNEKIDYLKMDIEGAEYDVIKECQSQLKNVANLFIEYHSFEDQDQSLHKILEILSRNNFRYHLTSPGLSSSNPFIKLNTYLGMDMQVNIYAKNLL